MGLLNFLGIASGILPLVGSVVQGVESLFGHGSGAQKKQAAIGMVQAGLQIAGEVTGNQNIAVGTPQFLNDLGNAIDSIVAVYNDLGVFTHAPAPAAKAAA